MTDLRSWIRLVENDDATELVDLQKRLIGMMAQWAAIKKTEPKPIDTGKGYSIHAPGGEEWHRDPERGRFWELKIYPLNQQIEQLETKIKQQRRVGLLHSKVGGDAGFDTSEILYHGTNTEFDVFDRSKTRTAAHLYTSPDIDTARDYGHIVYAVYGRQQPQADLSVESEDYALMRKVHRRGLFKRNWNLSLQDFSDLVTNGELYSYNSNSSLQDDVISTCLDTLKYNSVRITDQKSGGSYSDSVIFGNANDLQIIERVED
jgi:hypothetical protein